MIKKIIRSTVSIVLSICMLIPLISMSTISSSAKFNRTTLDTFLTNQCYTKAMYFSGCLIKELGKVTGDATVMNITNFISEKFLGAGGDNAVEETCLQILDVVNKMDVVVDSMNTDLKSDKINSSAQDYINAWNSQVMDVIKSGNTTGSFYGVYDAYLTYLGYACEPDKIPSGKTIEYYEEAYVSELENFYANAKKDFYSNDSILTRSEYYKYNMYTSDAIDEALSTIISTMLYNMNPQKNSIGNQNNIGHRFVDKAAQYAFYAFPNAPQQGEFMDMSIESQIDVISIMITIYQDLLSRRAEYYRDLYYTYNKFMIDDSNVDVSALSDKNKAMYERYLEIKNEANKTTVDKAEFEYVIEKINSRYSTVDMCDNTFYQYYDSPSSTNDYLGMLEKYMENLDVFLQGDIYLSKVNAHSNFNKYPKNNTVNYDVTLNNKLYKREYTCFTEIINGYFPREIEHKSQSNMSNGNSHFAKNFSVNIKDGELEFVPYYVFNGKNQDTHLRNFDVLIEASSGFAHFFNGHFMHVDYHNMKSGEFSDGTCTFVPIANESQLKNIINETYFTANNCTVSSYFSDMMGYAQGKQNYLLLNAKDNLEEGFGASYTNIPVVNMNNTSYPNIKSQTIDCNQYGDSVYSVILIPKGTTKTNVKLNTNLKSILTQNNEVKGEVKLSKTNAVAGEKVQLTIDSPDDYFIKEIIIKYHNNPNNLEEVTSEEKICGKLDVGDITIDYKVPYTNATIDVTNEYKRKYSSIETDENGNYLVSSYDDLCQIAYMVYSGYDECVKGTYILTNDITMPDDATWKMPIGGNYINRPFKGTFDGQGYTIYNFKMDPDAQVSNFGLFGEVENAKIKNLNIVHNSTSHKMIYQSLGGLCGKITNSVIFNCNVSGYIDGYAKSFGGIVGSSSSSIIDNCNSSGTLRIEQGVEAYDGICPNTAKSDNIVVNCTSNAIYIKYNNLLPMVPYLPLM